MSAIKLSDALTLCEDHYIGSVRRSTTEGKTYSKTRGGWELFSTKKPDLTLEIWTKHRLAVHERRSHRNEIGKKFNALFGGYASRAKVAYDIMPDDLDGVWSELNMTDDNRFSFEDIKEGSKLYNAYEQEANA